MGKIIVYPQSQREMISKNLLFDCAGKYKVLLSNPDKFKINKNKTITLSKDIDLVSYCKENGISRLKYLRESADTDTIEYEIITTNYPDNYIKFIRDNIDKLDFVVMPLDPVVIQSINEIGIKPIHIYNSKVPIYSNSLSRSYRLKYEYELDIEKLSSVHLDFIFCKTYQGRTK